MGFTADSVYSLAPWVLIGTVIGARTLYVFSYWDEQFAGRAWYTIFNIRSGDVSITNRIRIGSWISTICQGRPVRRSLAAPSMTPSRADTLCGSLVPQP